MNETAGVLGPERRASGMRAKWRRIMHGRTLSLVGAMALCAVLILNIVLAFQLSRSEPFDPLGDYPIQIVNSRVEGVDGPAAVVGGDVSVTGIKCVNGDQPVEITGVVSWVSIKPAGSTIETGSGSTERLPGCTEQTFENPMPDAITERTLELLEGGEPFVIWSITGTETPVRGDSTGVPAIWRTENFKVVPAP